MLCPYCNSDLVIPENVITNVNAYNTKPLIPTSCCGKGIRVKAVVSYEVAPNYGPDRLGDWDNKIKESLPPCKQVK